MPSVSERQLRALSGGESGLADLLLTVEERAGLSAAEALRRAETALAALKRRWLMVIAVPDAVDTPKRYGEEHSGCALSAPTDANAADGLCGVAWTMTASARCGFASDWCVGVGPSWGGVWLDERNGPERTGGHEQGPYRTSEATASASGAVAVLLQAYRDADGRLTVPAGTVLKRLHATARRDVLDRTVDTGSLVWTTPRIVLRREEVLIRSLLYWAGASDDDLRELIDTARRDLNGSGTDGDDERPDKGDRLRVLNRLVPWLATWDLDQIGDILNAAEADPAVARGLLAQLIRQVEWIDEQLRRRGRDKNTATEEDVRQISITSLIGHGLIDLKAATDPAR